MEVEAVVYVMPVAFQRRRNPDPTTSFSVLELLSLQLVPGGPQSHRATAELVRIGVGAGTEAVCAEHIVAGAVACRRTAGAGQGRTAGTLLQSLPSRVPPHRQFSWMMSLMVPPFMSSQAVRVPVHRGKTSSASQVPSPSASAKVPKRTAAVASSHRPWCGHRGHYTPFRVQVHRGKVVGITGSIAVRHPRTHALPPSTEAQVHGACIAIIHGDPGRKQPSVFTPSPVGVFP
ncbi:MAG: hypothetical protein IPF41_05335 [Flavobacteriales bacterium]|nr:hypothetical protein [Flavobacteriales bacterium]